MIKVDAQSLVRFAKDLGFTSKEIVKASANTVNRGNTFAQKTAAAELIGEFGLKGRFPNQQNMRRRFKSKRASARSGTSNQTAEFITDSAGIALTAFPSAVTASGNPTRGRLFAKTRFGGGKQEKHYAFVNPRSRRKFPFKISAARRGEYRIATGPNLMTLVTRYYSDNGKLVPVVDFMQDEFLVQLEKILVRLGGRR